MTILFVITIGITIALLGALVFIIFNSKETFNARRRGVHSGSSKRKVLPIFVPGRYYGINSDPLPRGDDALELFYDERQ